MGDLKIELPRVFMEWAYPPRSFPVSPSPFLLSSSFQSSYKFNRREMRETGNETRSINDDDGREVLPYLLFLNTIPFDVGVPKN